MSNKMASRRWPGPTTRPTEVSAAQQEVGTAGDNRSASQDVDIVRFLTPVEEKEKGERGLTPTVNRQPSRAQTRHVTIDG